MNIQLNINNSYIEKLCENYIVKEKQLKDEALLVKQQMNSVLEIFKQNDL